ncbi:MAG TPA: hypothetical protein DEA89_02695 [Candidatus Moranbacteria bacterium]|nr:hypothetical protein [Candidatus Moranbacteria bacterium]HBI50724.1 hypothetical protein [Candidatus Moranbacteria bacterium]HBU10797.1 hypothetical protein [Candidatus Moranbacteria bacterium]HCO99760.1 hypothetical protein [Candidatus Moranbacteria bacterium]
MLNVSIKYVCFMISSAQLPIYIAILGVFLAVVSLIFGIWTMLKLRATQRNLEILFSGKKAVDLESILLAHTEEISAIDKEIQELFEISNKIHNLSQRSLHKVGIIRFNPFKDIGGDQSFAIALLDGKDCGITISSLHTREGTRIYSKPITKGESEKYTLTEEEKAAIKSAVTIKPSKI